MNQQKLTTQQAYLAMFSFLNDYYQMTQSDDIGSLLGSMSFLENGHTADPAVESDWMVAVERTLSGKTNANLDLRK